MQGNEFLVSTSYQMIRRNCSYSPTIYQDLEFFEMIDAAQGLIQYVINGIVAIFRVVTGSI